jgi:hypothetical protein
MRTLMCVPRVPRTTACPFFLLRLAGLCHHPLFFLQRRVRLRKLPEGLHLLQAGYYCGLAAGCRGPWLPPGGYSPKRKTNLRSALESIKMAENEPETNPNATYHKRRNCIRISAASQVPATRNLKRT